MSNLLIPVAGGDVFIPLSEAEISSLEGELGLRFPADYKRFLSIYGASTFTDIVFFLPIEPLPPPLSSTGKGLVDVLYGGDSIVGDAFSLTRRIRYFKGRIPENLIPIGDDGSGSQICMVVQGEDLGRIYFWDFNNEPLDEEDYLGDYGEPMPQEARLSNLHLIANSFSEFLERIHVEYET